MKKYVCWLAILSLSTLFFACNGKKNIEPEEAKYNPYVEAFSSGYISRFSPVYLIFSQDIPDAKQQTSVIKKNMRITPDVEGEFSLENNRTIVFKPKSEFQRNTTYRIDADLSSWFDANGEDAHFTFTFTTLPSSIRGEMTSFDISDKNDSLYDIQCRFYTADREKGSDIEQLVSPSEAIKTSWSHSPDGKQHTVTVQQVKPGINQRKLVLNTAANKLDFPESELLSIDIPALNTFEVYQVVYQTEPERFIEATFTRLLDRSQDLQGLVYIEGEDSNNITIENNKIKLYLEPKKEGALKLNLNRNIKSRDGMLLGKDSEHQIMIQSNLPEVRFVGNGVIIPQSTELNVPFQAVNLRGVIVRVLKIPQQNIGQFLQQNSLDSSNDLMQVGRLIARKTIFLDEQGDYNLGQWNTFALDLKKIMLPEEGAIYRVELSFDRRLSAYPCTELPAISKADILAEDVIKFREESNRFDDGGYYYYTGEMDWSDYNYRERNDPCSESYYFNKNVGKNVLASNLGLIAKRGENGIMEISVHNLLTTAPENDVTVTLYNYQHQELTSGKTDKEGRVQLQTGTSKPFYTIAMKNKQRAYLKLDNGSALSLSTFDVSGEVVQKGIKGYIYGERGVWRPGDTLHLSFMLNDRENTLPAGHPVVMEIYNPLGQLYSRRSNTQGVMGIYTFAIATEPDAPTGLWNASVSVGGATFNKRLRIESIKPNRLKITLDFPNKTILRNEPLNAKLHVQWLQGATARNMKYDIQGTFISTPTQFKGYEKFIFDNPAKQFGSEESTLITGKTDEFGNATIETKIEVGNIAPGMLIGNFVTKVYEESGDFSIDATTIRYSPYQNYVGIQSPLPEKEPLYTGKDYLYKIASVNYNGMAQPHTPVEIDIYKVDYYWWWSADNNQLANFVADSYNKPVKHFIATTDATGKASFKVNMPKEEWGSYLILIRDKESGHSTGLLSYFDWPDYESRRDFGVGDQATSLKFSLDKESYRPGEKIKLTFPSSKGSRALISIENGTKVITQIEKECQEGKTSVDIPVTAEMQPNAYVFITLIQPHAQTINDLPIRLYGVMPFLVNSPESHLYPIIQTIPEIKPDSRYTVTVSEKSGRPMGYTLAIVDEGLLDLTRFKTPDAWNAFNTREALGVRTWDLYNYVIGAYGGRIEQLFSIGGDDALNKGPKAIVNRFKPVVRFEGPFMLKKGEKQKHTFMMPNYIGKVRIMVVAGNGADYGNAEKSVPVRKPVMVLGTLPRVIGPSEEMVIPATVFATEPGIGTVNVTIKCSDNLQIVDGNTRQLNFLKAEDKMAYFTVKVKDKTGKAYVTLTASGKGEISTNTTDLLIRDIQQPQLAVNSVTLAPGQNITKELDLPGRSGTNSLVLEASGIHPIDLTSRLAYLVGYPHGCLEQIVSKAFPQLYLNMFSSLSEARQNQIQATIRSVISKLRSYQTAEGSFAYWSGQTSTSGWGSVYAGHFMCEAEKRGYLIPGGMKRSWLVNQQKIARTWKSTDNSPYLSSEQLTQAYRLFVLALAQSPEIGAMNRLKESASTLSTTTRYMLAGAYAQIGRKDIGNQLIQTSTSVNTGVDDLTFGSPDRDKAILLQTLCLLDKGSQATILAKELSEALASDEWMSTQTSAFTLIALAEYTPKYATAKSIDFQYTYNKKTETVKSDKYIWTTDLMKNGPKKTSVTIKNQGKGTLFVRFISEGIAPLGEEKAMSNGVSVRVSYQNMQGEPILIDSLDQGTNFIANVIVSNPTALPLREMVLTQLFPAGWEILNTRYLENVKTPDASSISYQDIRDDRVYSYIDYLPAGRQVAVRINLCAVYPGQFRLPSVNCQAMYDHLIRAQTDGGTVVVKR